ncbi:hypothetical protein NF212_24610 [Parasalinivibrio latis]|uniref:hypothetical protein n=1 Tax=Parasalinivibrio latis TaxID=2952610 RepID=UPI0030E56BEF
MFSFLARHSSSCLVLAAFAGFLFPEASNATFPFLPYVLFLLMLFTLLGINQPMLIKAICRPKAWIYAFVHTAVLTALSCSIAYLLGASDETVLAVSGIAATGSLFATPAIARSVGLDALEAMSFTITSTLLKPVVLYINLTLFSSDEFALNLSGYVARLLIFIFGPMAISALVHHFVSDKHLKAIHTKLSQYTIILVFSFPFGLIGAFREYWNEHTVTAIYMQAAGFGICLLFFIVGYVIYGRNGKESALIAGITSGNRNVLLTYTIAGAALGPVYLPLIGALQLPIYLQPLAVKWMVRRFGK